MGELVTQDEIRERVASWGVEGEMADSVIELIEASIDVGRKEAADAINTLRTALKPFAEPHAMGDNYVQFAPRLIQAARAAMDTTAELAKDNTSG